MYFCLFLKLVYVLFILDRIEEDLFNAKEKIMRMSFVMDDLSDSVLDLKMKLVDCQFEKKELQKQYNRLLRKHSKCRSRNIILYR